MTYGDQEIGAHDIATMNHTHIQIRGEINDYFVPIIIDSGAQISVISERLAILLKISHMIDRSKRGVVKGVGASQIVGCIYECPLKIGENIHMPINLFVMENHHQPNMFLLGLDVLNFYHCIIDFGGRTLQVDDKKISLLNEVECEKYQEVVHAPTERTKILVNNLLSDLVFEEKANLVNLLNKIFTNILREPTNQKFRDLNLDSKMLENSWNRYPGMQELFTYLGFRTNVRRLVHQDDLSKIRLVTQELGKIKINS